MKQLKEALRTLFKITESDKKRGDIARIREKLGVSRSKIDAWIDLSDTRVPGAEDFLAIEREFNIDIGELIKGNIISKSAACQSCKDKEKEIESLKATHAEQVCCKKCAVKDAEIEKLKAELLEKEMQRREEISGLRGELRMGEKIWSGIKAKLDEDIVVAKVSRKNISFNMPTEQQFRDIDKRINKERQKKAGNNIIKKALKKKKAMDAGGSSKPPDFAAMSKPQSETAGREGEG